MDAGPDVGGGAGEIRVVSNAPAGFGLAVRLPLLVLGMVALVAGVAGGLARLGGHALLPGATAAVSRMTVRLTGCPVTQAKLEISLGRSSSRTMKSSRLRPVTGSPSGSSTSMSRATRLTRTAILDDGSCDPAAFGRSAVAMPQTNPIRIADSGIINHSLYPVQGAVSSKSAIGRGPDSPVGGS